ADSADLVLTTGGIGHGAYDVVKELLGPHGRDSSRFSHLALRPGGPPGLGALRGGVPVVHLPGTPAGAPVGLHLFVRPLLPCTAPTAAPERACRTAGVWPRPDGRTGSRSAGPARRPRRRPRPWSCRCDRPGPGRGRTRLAARARSARGPGRAARRGRAALPA